MAAVPNGVKLILSLSILVGGVLSTTASAEFCQEDAESWGALPDPPRSRQAAVDHMTLSAAEIGLGTCWICAFDAKRCTQLLDLPDKLEPIVLLPLGYPAESKSPDRHTLERKPLEQIVPCGLASGR
jgi:nitroreductase